MKVLVICPNLAAGGAERIWSILLPGLRARGYDARLLALDGGGPFASVLTEREVPFEVLNMRHRTHLAPLVRSAIVRRFVPDVIVTQAVSALYVGRALARWRRAALIVSDHSGGSLSRRREAMVRAMRRWVDQVVIVAGDQSRTWIERGYPSDQIRIVRNGVEIPDVAESRTTIRRELRLPDSAIVAVLVATLRPEKRVPDFVDAIRRVKDTHADVVGVIVGDGPERLAIEKATNGTTAIRFLGHRNDVSRVLRAGDLLVLSSQYEAAPMAILEAMAAGLPVVATDVGAVRDMIADGNAGLLVPPCAPEQMAAKLAQLAADSRLRHSIGRANMERFRQRWNADLMIDGYAQIISGYGQPDSRRDAGT